MLDSLRTGDLALALGCARGEAQAWDTFCAQYRSVLYDAAYALVREEARARELADSLLAELFGVGRSEGGRRSRFAYFHARSSPRPWARTVLYQKFVDDYRRQSRLDHLPEGAGGP